MLVATEWSPLPPRSTLPGGSGVAPPVPTAGGATKPRHKLEGMANARCSKINTSKTKIAIFSQQCQST